jgi:hypothetical protein
MTPEQIALMASKLTISREEMILALPKNGDWGKVPDRAIAKRAWWSMSPPIIEHKHNPTDKNEWRLNDNGLRLRKFIDRRGGYRETRP